jgi:hypothetical protein
LEVRVEVLLEQTSAVR